MQSFDFKKYLPNTLIIVGFALLSLIYCYPAMQGKKLEAGDNISWKGMAQEGIAYHEKTGDNVLWSNSMFGGMPTYTHYVPGHNDLIYKVQDVILGALTKPANFLFIAMLSFFILMLTMNMNRWLSIAGAVAFAFSSYNVIIISAGHDTKMLSIAYMPAVLAGLLLLYRSKWWSGAALLGISLGLMVGNAHYQVMYYDAIIIGFAVIGMLFVAIKEGKIKQWLIASVAALVVSALAVGSTAFSLLPTYEYNKVTMRGGQSELTSHDKGKKAGGLDKEYAFRWSNGIGETFCILVPYLYGGSSGEPAEAGPKTAEMLGANGQQADRLPLYWGPQPFLSGPVYFGAIICFLFVLGLMIVPSPHKWWIAAVCALAIVMSWGNHFEGVNYFLFDHIPMLNKFRTPSMILVIPQFLFPVLGIWSLNEIISGNIDTEDVWKKVKIALGITAGLSIILGLGSSMFFNFSNAVAESKYPAQFISALKEDRSAMAMKSGLVSAIYILISGGVIWAFIKNKIKAPILIGGIGLLIAIDLISVDARYLGEDKYKDAGEYEATFQPRRVDQMILQDKDPYYRVLDVTKDTYNDASQAYFHKCIGGYHPAKMEIYQDLIDNHLSGQKGFNAQVLNMLNTKYIIFSAGNKQENVMPNPNACGNAWFVEQVKWMNTADEEMAGLKAENLGDTNKVANAFDPKKTAVIRNTFKKDVNVDNFVKDSAAKITLTKYGLNDLEFSSTNSKEGLGVFSDIYYALGWTATIDGKETPIVKANYVLRAIKIPAGQHKIEFHFHPQSYYTGNTISLISSVLLFGLLIGALYKMSKEKEGVA
jgi:hypothetical protein